MYLSVLGVRVDNDVIMQISLTDEELLGRFEGNCVVPIQRVHSAPASNLQDIEVDSILAGTNEVPRWSVMKLSADRDQSCSSCDVSQMIKGRLAVICDGICIPLGTVTPTKKRFYFCAMQECIRWKPRFSNLIIPSLRFHKMKVT